MSIAMTKDEREAFLAGVHVGILSVNDPGRGPLSCPVWYAYEPGGEICFVTPANSRKVQQLAAGSRVSFLVQQEEMLPKYVSIEGSVLAVEPADVENDLLPITCRYLGAEIGDAYVKRTRGAPDAPDEVLVRIRPERWLSADFAKRVAGAEA